MFDITDPEFLAFMDSEGLLDPRGNDNMASEFGNQDERSAQEIEVMRASEEWQRAGAYSVRVQGMNRQYGIPLREEFDEHDGEGTKYIVLLDDLYPVATCRFYELDETTVAIGRVVVLPEYRENQLGRKVICEAENWIRELGYREIVVESRTVAVGFYEKCGFHVTDGTVVRRSVFDCVRMSKALK